jgi:hypothetical protein
MKRLLLIFTLLTGCAHHQLSCHETCALRSMKCTGSEIYGTHDYSYTKNLNRWLAKDSEVYTCEPATADEMVSVKKWYEKAKNRSEQQGATWPGFPHPSQP